LWLAFFVYWELNKMSHLADIEVRQKKSRITDVIFAAFVAFGAVVSITTISAVAQAASSHVVGR
jgi:hypothetical protein